MSIAVVRLGSPRAAREGPRLGTVRRPPRGVRKQDYGRLDYYDLWLPELAPSAEFWPTPPRNRSPRAAGRNSHAGIAAK